ncbi:MAG: type III pantothenate kinase [Bacteroidales bacterium]|nr:type III pantothenate kinase [Bacteroidales bacterium]
MVSLLIDAGNTSVKMAISRGDEITDEKRCDADLLIGEIDSYFHKYQNICVVAVSDVRGLPETVYTHLDKICKKVIRVKGDISLPINNRYGTPKTLGSDRICAAAGAHALFPGKDCVIVDFGTAITFDFLTKEGDFLGGNISLGLNTRFRALNHFTGKLPLLQRVENVEQIGNCTTGAMESGVILGTIFEIEGYIRTYPGYNFIFTGGDAIFFAKKLKSPIFVVCNLVLMGLSHIAKANAI